MTPTFHIWGAYPSDSPLEQCLAVDGWLMMMVGVALPLAAMGLLEGEARAAFTRRQRRQRRGSAAAGEAVALRRRAASAVRLGSALEELPEPEADVKPVQPHFCWRLLFTSSGAWAVSCLAATLWLRNHSS